MKRQLLFCGLLTTLLLAGCADNTPNTNNVSTNQQANAQQQLNWLFVIHANNAKISQDTSGQYILNLYPVKNVNAFTDRPYRQVKVLTAPQFVNLWGQGKDNFRQDNPNAAIAAILDRKSNVASDEMVTLKQPTYDAKTQSIKFVIQKMTKQEIIQAEKLHYTTLFIDDNSISITGISF